MSHDLRRDRVVVTGHNTQMLPPHGVVATVNADVTLVAGRYIEGDGVDYNQRPGQAQGTQPQLVQPQNKGQMMERRLAAHLPMALFTMSTLTGEVKMIHRATDRLNHLEFSPANRTC